MPSLKWRALGLHGDPFFALIVAVGRPRPTRLGGRRQTLLAAAARPEEAPGGRPPGLSGCHTNRVANRRLGPTLVSGNSAPVQLASDAFAGHLQLRLSVVRSRFGSI